MPPGSNASPTPNSTPGAPNPTSSPRTSKRSPKSFRERGTLTEPTRLLVFAYGTLKRGHSNHERFCRGALEIRKATVRGRLYDLPYGFPALVVPESDVRATGTPDYLSDALMQYHASPQLGASSAKWDAVHGELITFKDPEERLAALDVLEGYAPGEESLYERALIPVEVAAEVVLAWAYRVERAAGVYLPDGYWPAS